MLKISCVSGPNPVGSPSWDLPVPLVGDAAVAADVDVVVCHGDKLGGGEGLGGEARVEVADRVTSQCHDSA